MLYAHQQSMLITEQNKQSKQHKSYQYKIEKYTEKTHKFNLLRRQMYKTNLRI